jgi:hypothetical protein
LAQVFISFVHEDQQVAAAVQEYLSSKLSLAEHVFLSSDNWQIFAGETWLDRIKAELTAAKVVVLMLSKRSVGRPWVNFEAGAAWLSNKVVIPACYGNLTKDLLPKPYSGIQALNLRDETYYLLSSVAHHLGKTPPPQPSIIAAVANAAAKEKSPLEQMTDPSWYLDYALEKFVDM